MNVLIILGHPRKDSLCGALAEAYKSGALSAGVTLQEIVLTDLSFDPHVRFASINDQIREPDILQAQEWIAWADHLVFVYPTWWGTMPALLKGFLDRVLTPGFAFADREGGGWECLLRGKSAQLITTMDTPDWVYRWIYGAPGHRALARATLGFCGVAPIRILAFSPVKDASLERRQEWLHQAHSAGANLRHGILSPIEHRLQRIGIWLSALRLQFYPMTWVAYSIGALTAMPSGIFRHPGYWFGYLCLFFIEVATVLTNEYFDYATDRQNREYSPFNGGSRVLTLGHLGFQDVRKGIATALQFTALAAITLLCQTSSPATSGVLLTLGMILGLGYTMPPIKLVYRGFGEMAVGLTHGLLTVLYGFVVQGGDWSHTEPYLLGIPLSLSILPAILLSGIPDVIADRAVAKKTFAVRFGRERTVLLAMSLTLLAALSSLILQISGHPSWNGALFLIVPHAILLLRLLNRHRQQVAPPTRIDGLMIAALTYHAWFGLIPLFNALR